MLVRTATLTAILAILAGGGLLVWHLDREARLRQEIAQLEQRMAREVAAREAMIERLSRSHRRARIEVIGQEVGDSGFASERDGSRIVSTTIRFIELDDEGRELGRRDFTVPGDTVFLDAWTARFPKERVAEGDPLRGRTLVLFRRIYSDRLAASAGHPIDTPGGAPLGYAGSDRIRFEQAVWKNFWRLASDPEEALRNGIAVAQGEAVYKPMRLGEIYEVRLDAAAGLTLVPMGRERSGALRAQHEEG